MVFNQTLIIIFLFFLQVQLLQQQVTSLADTQSTADDRYARAKADNAVLQARVHMLDEQIREVKILISLWICQSINA